MVPRSCIYPICKVMMCFFSGLLPFLVQAQDNSFSWPEGKRAAISLSFDDARISHPEVGKDLFRKLGVKATFYVVPNNMKDHLEDWKDILADGHEVGNHTIHHPCTGNFPWSRDKALENYTLASMRQELLAANQQIYEMLGVVPASFAYTCGNTFVGRGTDTKSYAPLVAELFESGRGWLNEASNDPAFVDLSLLQGIEMDGKDFETDIKPLVDAAIENGTWLLLAGHEIGVGGRQTTRIEMLEKLVAYIEQHKDEIWLGTVGEVAAHIKTQRQEGAAVLKEALLLASTFDEGYHADYAKGDHRIHGAAAYDRHQEAIPAMVPEEVTIADNVGLYGHALEFKRKGQPVLFYQAHENMNYSTTSWQGTISLWLSLDPETDLAPGYTDPIQITDSGYDDAALWVDFTKENPRSFRMGVFGDVTVWNPDKKSPDTNPSFNNRLVIAQDRPFARGRWTHIVITFSGLNTDNGVATFYINGKQQGTSNITEPFTWEEEKAKIFLGLNFIGLMDEVAIFDRPLSGQEVRSLYGLVGGLGDLLKTHQR